MTRGSEASTEVRLIILRMNGAKIPTTDISYFTDIPLRTIQHIIHEFRTTGRFSPKERKGKKCKLNQAAMEVHSLLSSLYEAHYLRISLFMWQITPTLNWQTIGDILPMSVGS